MSTTTSPQESRDSGDVSRVIETPAPSKVRRRKKLEDVKSAQAEQTDTIVEATPQTRTFAGVVIPPPNLNKDDFESCGDAEEQEDSPSPEKQLRQEVERAARFERRAIAKPKSIIDRLKGIWDDCKKLALGFQEEREVTDMLFEIRQEVMAAGRRGQGY